MLFLCLPLSCHLLVLSLFWSRTIQQIWIWQVINCKCVCVFMLYLCLCICIYICVCVFEYCVHLYFECARLLFIKVLKVFALSILWYFILFTLRSLVLSFVCPPFHRFSLFRVALTLLFKANLRIFCYGNYFYFQSERKLISTSKASQSDSLWNRNWCKFKIGLLIKWTRSFLDQQ